MTNIIMIGDFGKDLDDEHSLILAAGLHKEKEINLLGVIANLNPSGKRASLAKGTLNLLNLENIPVGIGSSFGSDSEEYEFEIPYKSFENLYGDSLLKELFIKNENITLVLQSSLYDAALFIDLNESLFKDKIKEVVIMGGIQSEKGKPVLTGKYLQPDSSNNNTFSWSAATYLYAKLQELNIKTVVLSRHAVYQIKIPFKIYDFFEKKNPVLGEFLRQRHTFGLRHLWNTFTAPLDSPIRGDLPPRCNKELYEEMFHNGKEISKFEDPKHFYLYDSLNLVAAVEKYREKFFDSYKINNMEIIGIDKNIHNIKDKESLKSFIINMEGKGVS